ncbi:MAG TPA: hypothetical protein VFB15_07475 [Candidatus Binataceae bacterium]|nr:hypothetical protein [Candidatus Binataceae bacterium]
MLARYSFPDSSQLGAIADPARQSRRRAALQAAFDEARQRGHAEGLEQGRAEAATAAQEALARARAEGYEAGIQQGLNEITELAEALRSALAQIDAERVALLAQAEALAVDLALAVVERLCGTDKARTDFIERALAAATRELAPAAPIAIHLNPANAAIGRSRLAALPIRIDPALGPGCVRVDAGRLVVEADLDQAFAELRQSLLDTRARRRRAS